MFSKCTDIHLVQVGIVPFSCKISNYLTVSGRSRKDFWTYSERSCKWCHISEAKELAFDRSFLVPADSCSFAHEAKTRWLLQFVLAAFNTYGVLIPARGIAYTNITLIVIPLSLCKYTIHLFVQPVHLRSTRTIVTQRTRYLRAR